jgi:HemY protein
MTLALKLWLALLLGGAAAAIVYHDSGYALLSYGVWSVEMSLALLVLLVFLAFTLSYLVLRSIARAIRLPAEARAWRQRRGAALARQALTQGLIEMSEGNWAKAEKRLVRHAPRSETPLLNYLAAARAAKLQGQHERRDYYIRLAHQSMPSADVAVSLTQAELQLADQQYEQALATLSHLRQIAPKHTYVLRLLRRIYEQLGDWDQLRLLLPELRKLNVLTADELQELNLRVHGALLERASLSVEKTRLGEAWAAIPRVLRRDHRLVEDYAQYLHERDQEEEAEVLVRDTLQATWSDDLIELYGLLDTGQAPQQIAFAEILLRKNPRNPKLLLALGRLCLRAKLWGKARHYLEASISAEGPIEAYRELGHLLEGLGEPERAVELYRLALSGTGGPEPVTLPQQLGHGPSNQPPGGPSEISVPQPHVARPRAESG